MSKILVVDDDADLAELIKMKLVAERHEVFSIHSGEGAFEAAKQIKPDIILLDIMLPGVTGYQICRRLRKDPELYPVAILLLTALGEEPEMLHGLEQGADDYLAKPFKLEHLMEKVAGLQSLLQAVREKHSITDLPGTEAVKRELNHRLARNAPISVCYMDMAGFKPYCSAYGREGQHRALQYIAQLLRQLIRNMGIYESFISHLGGEHFVVILNLEDSERFCNALMQSFDANVKQLYNPEDAQKGRVKCKDRSGNLVRHPLMALSIGVANNQYRQFKSAKRMFEVLAQVRQMAQPDSKSAIFYDRRRTDR